MSEQPEVGTTPETGTETKPKPKDRLTLKVSEKGALSVYGLGRFPVTLYKEQWTRLLDQTNEIRTFLNDNDDKLKKKEV